MFMLCTDSLLSIKNIGGAEGSRAKSTSLPPILSNSWPTQYRVKGGSTKSAKDFIILFYFIYISMLVCMYVFKIKRENVHNSRNTVLKTFLRETALLLWYQWRGEKKGFAIIHCELNSEKKIYGDIYRTRRTKCT